MHGSKRGPVILLPPGDLHTPRVAWVQLRLPLTPEPPRATVA